MTLSSHQIRYFRSQAHSLKPVVMIGEKGLTDQVTYALEQALEDHELVKISIAGADREARRAITHALCQRSGAELIQLIGRVSVLYRPSQKLKKSD